MANGMQELRQTIRRLAATPMVTIPAVLSLALAVGANGAVFGVIKGLLLDPLPYEDSGELVRVWGVHEGREGSHFSVSYPNYQDLAEAPALSGLAVYQGGSYTLDGGDRPERVAGVRATASLFDVLGVPPQLGRVFRPGEDGAEGERVAVLSHASWRDRFESDPAVLGRALLLDGEPYVVVGVMPEGFSYPLEWPDVYVPLLEDESTWSRPRGGLSVVGRMADDASLDQLRSQLAVIAGRIAEASPRWYSDWTVGAGLLTGQVYGAEFRLMLYTLLGAVFLLLLIASINVSNLLVARTTGRQREVAVRVALGAGRGRVASVFLLESVLLGTAGGVLGLAGARTGIGVLRRLAPQGVARAGELAVDPWVMVVTLILALGAGLLFGILPAVQAQRTGPAAALRAGGGREQSSGGRGRRMQRVLVSAQVALVLVVLTAAGLMARTMARLQAVDPGFDVAHTLTASVDLTSDYDELDEVTAFQARVLERIRATPGVEAAGATRDLPLAGSNNWLQIMVDESPYAREGFENRTGVNYVTTDYFRTMGIPVLEGRAFEDGDRAGGRPVTVVNRELADQFWPGESAIGKQIAHQQNEDGPIWLTVVGVAGNVRHSDLGGSPRPAFFKPWPQLNWVAADMTFVIRGRDPGALAPAVREAVRAADPGQAVYEVEPMAAIVDQILAEHRGLAVLLTLFGVVALALAAVGVFGVVSYSVTKRRHEMGIRAAFGASGPRLLRLVVGEGLIPVAAGIGVGLLAATATTSLLADLLYEVEPLDPLTFVTVPAVLLAISVGALWIPARRAARLDPVEALRVE